MSRRLLCGAAWVLGALGTGLVSGCVERTYTVLTNPPGAMVLENGHEVGPTPLIKPFQYYGSYRFRIIANGYQTLVVDQPIRTPWYEYFPLDFIAENIIPFVIRDHLEFRYDLKPLEVVPPEVVRDAAGNLRMQGKAIGDPLAPGKGPPPAVCPPCPAPAAPVGPPVPQVAPIAPPSQPMPPPSQPVPPPGPPVTPAWQPSQPPPAAPGRS